MPNNNYNRGQGEGGIIWFFGQMFFIPLRTFLCGLEILLDSVRTLSVGAAGAPANKPPERLPTVSGGQAVDGQFLAATGGVGSTIGGKSDNQEKKNMDKDLNDDLLKLVRYKILFVKRGDEEVLREKDELVYDNMDGPAFTAWKIAEYIEATKTDSKLKRVGKDDEKYLRVFYEVLERSPRERFKYEEDQIQVLKEIRDRLTESKAAGGGTSGDVTKVRSS